MLNLAKLSELFGSPVPKKIDELLTEISAQYDEAEKHPDCPKESEKENFKLAYIEYLLETLIWYKIIYEYAKISEQFKKEQRQLLLTVLISKYKQTKSDIYSALEIQNNSEPSKTDDKELKSLVKSSPEFIALALYHDELNQNNLPKFDPINKTNQLIRASQNFHLFYPNKKEAEKSFSSVMSSRNAYYSDLWEIYEASNNINPLAALGERIRQKITYLEQFNTGLGFFKKIFLPRTWNTDKQIALLKKLETDLKETQESIAADKIINKNYQSHYKNHVKAYGKDHASEMIGATLGVLTNVEREKKKENAIKTKIFPSFKEHEESFIQKYKLIAPGQAHEYLKYLIDQYILFLQRKNKKAPEDVHDLVIDILCAKFQPLKEIYFKNDTWLLKVISSYVTDEALAKVATNISLTTHIERELYLTKHIDPSLIKPNGKFLLEEKLNKPSESVAVIKESKKETDDEYSVIKTPGNFHILLKAVNAGGMGTLRMTQTSAYEDKAHLEARKVIFIPLGENYASLREAALKEFNIVKDKYPTATYLTREANVKGSQGEIFPGIKFEIYFPFLNGKDLADWYKNPIDRKKIQNKIYLQFKILKEVLLDLKKNFSEKNLVHRDIKPDNIFLGYNELGEPIIDLIDPGLAVAMGENGPAGTPGYYSYHTINSGNYQLSSDLYGLGASFMVFNDWYYQYEPNTDYYKLYPNEYFTREDFADDLADFDSDETLTSDKKVLYGFLLKLMSNCIGVSKQAPLKDYKIVDLNMMIDFCEKKYQEYRPITFPPPPPETAYQHGFWI